MVPYCCKKFAVIYMHFVKAILTLQITGVNEPPLPPADALKLKTYTHFLVQF